MKYSFQHIASTDLRDFVKFLGWQQLQEAVADGLFVLKNPNFAKRQLIFPINSDTPNYAEAVENSLKKLAALQDIPLPTIVSMFEESRDDTLRFRVRDARDENGHIPLAYAGDAAISGLYSY